MEEAEVPLEHLHEQVHHTAEHSRERWISWVALSTAILAVLAAIAGLLSGRTRKRSNDEPDRSVRQVELLPGEKYQGRRTRCENGAVGHAIDERIESKRARYEKEQEEIKSEAEHKEAAAKSNFHKHEVFARGVTMFQIAIAIAAISALTRRRPFWIVSLLFGAVGCAFLVLAAITR